MVGKGAFHAAPQGLALKPFSGISLSSSDVWTLTVEPLSTPNMFITARVSELRNVPDIVQDTVVGLCDEVAQTCQGLSLQAA